MAHVIFPRAAFTNVLSHPAVLRLAVLPSPADMAALARYKEHTKQRGGESSSAQRPPDSDSRKLGARAVYFEDKHDLPEAKEHLVSSASAMGVAVQVYGYAPNAMETYSDALCDLASSAKHAATGWVHLAIIGGGHVTDPHVQGYSLGGTYSPWPPELPLYMRVSPIANWSDDLVWRFLNLMGLRYCPLYDQGFTSLQVRRLSGPTYQLTFLLIHPSSPFMHACKHPSTHPFVHPSVRPWMDGWMDGLMKGGREGEVFYLDEVCD